MESATIKNIRAKLGKTQNEISGLLGVSIKAVHSYEQGWRKIPHHVQRMLYFFLFKKLEGRPAYKKCWEINNCSLEKRIRCPAWEFDCGDICWFINGTVCSGKAHKNWKEKIAECKECDVFKWLYKSAVTAN